MPQHYGNKKKRRSGDPILEPGVAAATRRSQRTRKAAPTKGRKRTSDPNLEPGVEAATRRSQRSPKVTPTIENRLVPNIGTPVPGRRVLEFPPAFETDFPYGIPATPRIVTPRTVTPRPTGKRTGTTKRRRR